MASNKKPASEIRGQACGVNVSFASFCRLILLVGRKYRMDHQLIISALDAEIARLREVRAILVKDGVTIGVIGRKGAKKVAAKKPVKRVLSAEARARIATAQKKRWAKTKRAAKKAAFAPTAAAQ